MGKLSSAIVQRRLASLQDVEEALARQVLYGGDLATNLLEQAPTLSERSLTDLLAETQGLAAAPVGEIPTAHADALRLVPGDVALRHGLYPLEQHEGTLIVAVSEPLKPDVEQDLGFGLGVRIDQRAAPLVRIRQAISRDYGLPLDRRTERVLAKLEGRPDPNPSLMPEPFARAPDITSLPRPPSMPPIGLPSPTDMTPLYTGAEPPRRSSRPAQKSRPPSEKPTVPDIPKAPMAPQEPVPTIEPPSVHDAVTSRAPVVADAPTRTSPQYSMPPGDLLAWSTKAKQSNRQRGRHRGPYTAAAAEQDLSSAEGRDDILVAFFDFASQYFEYSALFAVHGDLAEGRDAYGPGASRTEVMGIGVSIDMPGALTTARDGGRFTLVALEAGGIDGRIAKDLKRKAGQKVLLLPILVRNRCVLILYGDNGDADVELSEIGDVIAFAPLVVTAFENVILRRKTGKGSPEASGPASLRQGQRRKVVPSREERAETLAQALETTVRRVSSRPPIPLSKRSTSPAMQAVLPNGGDLESGSSMPPGQRSATPAQGTPVQAAHPQEGGGPIFELTRRSSPPEANEPPEEGWEVEEPIALPMKKRPPALPNDSPEIAIGVAEVGVDWTEEVERPSVQPDSQVVAPAQLPLKRHSSSELRLPTVIINLDDDADSLARRVVEGDETVVERLAAMGARAASVLVARFPGPIKADSDRLGTDRLASQRGPVLRALARIGAPAVPFLAVRSNDASPEIRGWATRLLGEIPTVESAHAVARRVIDASSEVRRGALEAGRLLQSNEESRISLADRISSMAEDESLSLESRNAAIEALAHLRDARAVPRLIRLAARADEVGKSAQWALSIITRQAYGRDAARWDTWWKENGANHRIVWLIDALMHEDPEIRRMAGEELKTLTKEYFGYYDDLTKSERAKAQKRYRQWWESAGKARFSK